MRSRKHRWFLPVLGLSVAGLFALGLALLIAHVIQPAMSRETWGRTIAHGDVVNLWFPEDSLTEETAGLILCDLEATLRHVMQRANVVPEELPLPIDVFLHENTGQLMQSLANRKSINTMNLASPLDVMSGTDASTALTELVLSHAWGDCRSQVLYLGTVLLMARPERDFHDIVAARPEESRDSVETLASLEAAGVLPRTYYQEHNSPYSGRFLVTLDAFAEFLKLRSGDPLAFDETAQVLECASLVQYVAEELGGAAELRAYWLKGFARPCLESAFGEPVAALTEAWYRAAETHKDSEEYDHHVVRYLIEAGDAEKAFDMASEWLPNPGPSESELLIRSALLAGRLAEVRAWSDGLVAGSTERARQWVEACHVMDCSGCEDIRVLGALSGEALSAAAAGAMTGYAAVIEALDLDDAAVPSFVLLVSQDASSDAVLKDLIGAGLRQMPAAVLRQGEDAAQTVIRTLPNCLLTSTRSLLLQRGLAVALTTPFDQLIAEARRLRTDGLWIGFASLDYMGRDAQVVDTEVGLLVAYLLDVYGPQVVKDCWVRTSVEGGRSLSRSLWELTGKDLRAFEADLIASWMPDAS